LRHPVRTAPDVDRESPITSLEEDDLTFDLWHVTLDRLFALETFGIKLGLENITRLCEALGHPERSFTSLHVAGTNGKGSVTAMAHAALRAAGAAAARYTSPHLGSLAERFVVGDAPVDEASMLAAADDVLNCAERLRAEGVLSVLPTFFEATTAIGFELFRRAAIDVAVIEVGLGGRFDATNVITPVAGAITTIAFDHQQHLGHTLGSIAFEKAGIIKPGMTVVAGALPPEAMAVVRRAADERGARLLDSSADTRLDVTMIGGRARVRIETPVATYGPVDLCLRGEHQASNAVVAVRLLEAAAESGVAIGRRDIERGLAAAEWPARLELLPLDGGRRVLLDAAHNAEGAEALATYLRRWHPERPPLVLGVMRDKDVTAILHALLPVVSSVVATQAPGARAMPAQELARRIAAVSREIGPAASTVTVQQDPEDAIAAALSQSDTICIAGSIFLAGAVRDGLKRRAILQ
jgi:dihydrofolate synthase/folylpolyglutamate synthase